MDIFDKQIVKFWEALANNDVKYLLVGGYAAILHGFERLTGDMDIWIEDTLENRQKLRAAFKEYRGIDYFMIETMQFVPGWSEFRLNNGMRLDIMTDMKGLETLTFNDCFLSAKNGKVEQVPVRLIDINHLLLNKKAVNRLKDQLDILNLERIQQLLRDEFPESGQ